MTHPVVIADTNALIRLLTPRETGHAEHKSAFAQMAHLVVSPLVLAELDHIVTTRANPKTTLGFARFIKSQADLNRFTVADIAPHLSTAIAVAEGYTDARGGKGIGLTDAMNVALAKAYRTDALFTTDKDFRIIQPLTGHAAFRLLPEDL
ncbi:PIN domain-containing protein [Streptomyces beijiangensis]|uniref:Ribonuclease VapC n=1 Tax=Streptomyces beijiangensis TaxID=163361 RepID=A0A939JI04_9ACTN|nr:PIN domain-containing protein [Streptomyces beijiangensis]MBO0512660.1 PIN domain-containing protein [Streptomyces beijiangensis]